MSNVGEAALRILVTASTDEWTLAFAVFVVGGLEGLLAGGTAEVDTSVGCGCSGTTVVGGASAGGCSGRGTTAAAFKAAVVDLVTRFGICDGSLARFANGSGVSAGV